MTWFQEPKRAWIGLGALWLVGFIGALTRFIMAFFQVRISEDLGIGRGFISMAWSTNLLIAALCAPLGGWLADRYGPKRILLVSALFGIAGTGIVVFGGQQDIVFFIGYGVVAGFAGIGSTTTYLLIFDWFKRHRAKATALLASASSLGLAISTPIFVSASWLTWKDAFLASFVLSLAVTLPVIVFGIKAPRPRNDGAEEEPANEPVEGEGSTEKIAAPPSRASRLLPVFFVVAIALFACGFNMGTVEMNLVAIHQLASVSPGMIALSMSVLGIMEIVGSLLFGYGLDRINKLVMMALLYGVRIVGFSVLFLHLGWSPVAFAVAFGLTYLSAIPGGLLVIKDYGRGSGNQTGWLLLFHQGGGILGTLFGGLSFDYFRDYQALIGIDVLICALAAFGYFSLYIARGRGLSKRKGLAYAIGQNAGA